MNLPALTSLRRFDTHRLLPAKYSANFDSVLTRLTDPDSDPGDLEHIFQLDSATNARLIAEDGRSLDITARELVAHVPQAHVINAAFTHPNPLGARFSSADRGAWYAAFEIATSKAEVLFHKSVEYAEVDWKEREEVVYDDYLADFTGTFHDLRYQPLLSASNADVQERQSSLLRGLHDQPHDAAFPPFLKSPDRPVDFAAEDFAACLDPGSYVASESLAEQLLHAGSLGLIYPSVRRPGGTCIACFRPSVVANVRKGWRYKLTWTPNRATFVRLDRAAVGIPSALRRTNE